jgi:hypothetical protein
MSQEINNALIKIQELPYISSASANSSYASIKYTKGTNLSIRFEINLEKINDIKHYIECCKIIEKENMDNTINNFKENFHWLTNTTIKDFFLKYIKLI